MYVTCKIEQCMINCKYKVEKVLVMKIITSNNAGARFVAILGKEGLCMAKIERSINGDFDQVLSNIENGILSGSMSATLEDASDFRSGTARCSVRVFERYSYAGGNRVSLNITLFQNDKDPVQLSAITAGGSQAVFFKINTWGEEAFLDKLIELLD